MSGLGALVLNTTETKMIERQYCKTLRSLMKLPKKTPRAVVYCLAGSLPGTAVLHLRQFSLFGMITRLPGSILYQHACNILQSKTISRGSWFHQIRSLCLMYDLPHPLDFLEAPMTKNSYKLLVKKKVINYWEIYLRNEAASLQSLSSFKPTFMSLKKPHPLWSTAGSSPTQVSMAIVQATMLSGRYRTEALLRHFSPSKTGSCLLSEMCVDTRDSICHILCACPALNSHRNGLLSFTSNFASRLPFSYAQLLLQLCDPSNNSFCDFLIDCSSFPEVISLEQEHGHEVLEKFFMVTRTWIFVLHRERLKLLGRWRLLGY